MGDLPAILSCTLGSLCGFGKKKKELSQSSSTNSRNESSVELVDSAEHANRMRHYESEGSMIPFGMIDSLVKVPLGGGSGLLP